LQAFKNVHTLYPESKLEIIGDGQMRPAIEAWITHNKLTEIVILHGWQEHVAPLMKQWDCFVLSSLWEGLPCAIVEARLLKLPVISYDTGGIKDIIFHGQNGLLIPQKDVERLAHAMERIINDKDLHAAFSSYNDNLSDFDNNIMIQNHQDLYFRL
jgi:glycosyltransferase involved in cell wall biosynthesis